MITFLLALAFDASATKLERTAPVHGLTWALSSEHCSGGWWHQSHIRAYWITTRGKLVLPAIINSKAVAPINQVVHDVWSVEAAIAGDGCVFEHKNASEGVLGAICPATPGGLTVVQTSMDTGGEPAPGDWIMVGISIPTRKAIPGECPE